MKYFSTHAGKDFCLKCFFKKLSVNILKAIKYSNQHLLFKMKKITKAPIWFYVLITLLLLWNSLGIISMFRTEPTNDLQFTFSLWLTINNNIGAVSLFLGNILMFKSSKALYFFAVYILTSMVLAIAMLPLLGTEVVLVIALSLLISAVFIGLTVLAKSKKLDQLTISAKRFT